MAFDNTSVGSNGSSGRRSSRTRLDSLGREGIDCPSTIALLDTLPGHPDWNYLGRSVGHYSLALGPRPVIYEGSCSRQGMSVSSARIIEGPRSTKRGRGDQSSIRDEPMVSCGRAAQSNGRPSVEAMTGHERADHDQGSHTAGGKARQPRSSRRA